MNLTPPQKTAVLFDVDGTLMRADGTGREAMAQGLAHAGPIAIERAREVVGSMDFRGCTDKLIVEGMAERAGVTLQGREADLLSAYVAALEAGLRDKPATLLPGVTELVAALEAGGVYVGLLTGNMRAGARVKLSPFGLQHLVDRQGGFGDDGRERSAIARQAVKKLQALGVNAHCVVVIGDTQHDVTGARAAGACAVTVATGWTSAEDLLAAKPDLHMRDLSDATPLWDLLKTLRGSSPTLS